MVAWFIKGPVFHSVNSKPDRMVDRILLEACNLYGTVIDPLYKNRDMVGQAQAWGI